MKDWKEFDEELGKSRNRFVDFINSLEWNTKLRTEADSLLIMYDQSRSRLQTHGDGCEYYCSDCDKLVALEKVEKNDSGHVFKMWGECGHSGLKKVE